jgi:hypothetical protein
LESPDKEIAMLHRGKQPFFYMFAASEPTIGCAFGTALPRPAFLAAKLQ